ncbi:MAG: DegT/DnrJ/EryC1/StrS family aminotransferase [Nitrospirota bacterium]|nr:DegT/DnrJ/EryC1/StrS family aminotransferase [Nitrospirota bacterium]
MDFIPVCEPFLNGNELKYVTEAVKTGWISSSGNYVREFEESFARYCGVKFGVAVCNGTVALHLAVVAAGIKPGDEVIIPNFTMVSTAFALCYAGATPVFIDAEPGTWNMNADAIEGKISPRTKAIMPVSIFGHPCEMERIWSLAEQYGLIVIEDAAESHGAEYKGKKTGSLADMTAFSFFSNKNLTTGEGGMVVTDNEEFYRKSTYFKNVCFPMEGPRNYRHEDIGFNYRMSNLHAALGVAQVEKANEYRALRIRNGGLYRKYLEGIPGISLQGSKSHVVHVFWMNGVLVDPERYGRTRDELMSYLQKKNIETRLFFYGMHRQPSLLKYGCDGSGSYPVTDNLTNNGFYLPSSSSLREDQISYISDAIREFHR